jgi:hypothetical protein
MKKDNRVMYSGKLSTYQSNTKNFNGKSYQVYDKDPFNPNQNFLYKRAMFGITMYTEAEQAEMSDAKKQRVIKAHRKTQFILNSWKQEIIIKFSNSLLGHFFKDHPFLNPFWENTDPDPKFVCTLSFKDLGINKKDIIDKLIDCGILPINFYQIT